MAATKPAYQRLTTDERRRQIIDAGSGVFAEHAYEEISMRQIAAAAGVSKPLLYHYFPSKNALFLAAIEEQAAELQAAIAPSGEGTPLEQLSGSIDSYLGWIEDHKTTWTKLVQGAATLPEARTQVESFRDGTMNLVLMQLTGGADPRPALRSAIRGWLGYMDAVIVDWVAHGDLSREQLLDMILASFGASLLGAQQVDPTISLTLG
jgi:AcrR family transcriptional regulator